jgi:predicted MFS family arabinose efflux permease
MTQLNSRSGRAALIVSHIAGMIDLVALPLWISTLIAGFSYAPAQAGALPSLFLLGATIMSVILSRGFHKTNGRVIVPLGFWIAAASFFAVTKSDIFAIHAVLHFIAGLGAGAGLSIVHGKMGQTGNPHRVFAVAGVGLGVFAIVFLGGVPQLINAISYVGFFYAMSATMAVAALVTTLMMPAKVASEDAPKSAVPLPKSVKFAIGGVMGMALVQGMVFSFLVQVGNFRGFGEQRIEVMLIVLGFVGLVPPALAALLEKKLPAMTVAKIGPVVQAVFAVSIMTSTAFLGFAIPAVMFAGVMIFTHAFVFGFMAEQEPSGRAVAATPAILMTGTAIAPFIGGVLVQEFGYPAIGIFSVVVAIVSIVLFTKAAGSVVSKMGQTTEMPQQV